MIETMIGHSVESRIYQCRECRNDYLVQLSKGDVWPEDHEYRCRSCTLITSLKRPIPIIGTDEVVGGKGR